MRDYFNFRDHDVTAYEMWAPRESVWSRWAKPVVFMNYQGDPRAPERAPADDDEEMFDISPDEFEVSPIAWFGGFRQDTAIILELPGAAGVEEAIAFAKIGYRPVPLYNGVYAKKAVVDTADLAEKLFLAAKEIVSMRIPAGAPPVFMLDSNRKDGTSLPMPGMYDNRWNIFAQDMPSADFFRSRGIRNILVRTRDSSPIECDLQHVLYRYAESRAVTILRYGGHSIKPFSVSKPKSYKSVFYRLMTILGLQRNAAGGFGTWVAQPSEVGVGYGGG